MNQAASKSKNISRVREILICFFLILTTLAVYGPVRNFEFINMDDWSYVTRNPVIQSGLSWENFKWAFQNRYATNWHPLTALSHMLDCQLFGLNAGAHHLANLIFHLLNTLLLFAVLRRMTGALWRSAMVAALFALHPLHVESVAWVSERKDVLSGFFFLLTIWFYVGYQRSGTQSSKLKIRNYFCALFFFALGLLSKPMLVTLPFVLLLLDFWPLQRISFSDFYPQKLSKLFLEKLPFFALAIIFSIVTFFVQRGEGAVMAVEKLPLAPRSINALVSYVRYLAKTIWPESLAAFYPYEIYFPLWQIVGAIFLLVGITTVALWLLRRAPYLFVGWFWFVGMLVPVIGLVQVGSQSMADRYTYLPHIGFFIALIWGVSELFPKGPNRMITLRVLAVAVLIGCVSATSLQVRHWRNSESLFRHAIKVTRNNYAAYNNLGTALDESGQHDEAEACFRKALEIKPDYAESNFNLSQYWIQKGDFTRAKEHLEIGLSRSPNNAKAHYNLANIFVKQDDLAEAGSHYAAALKIRPDYPQARNNFAVLLLKQEQRDEAIAHFREAVKRNPEFADALNNLGGTLTQSGRPKEAVPYLLRAIQSKPDYVDAHYNLGDTYYRMGEIKEAMPHFIRVLELEPKHAAAHYQMGVILSLGKNFEPAIAHYKEAIRLKPDWLEPINNLAWILATNPEGKLRDGKLAVELGERACGLTENKNPGALDTLAAAYAERGEFVKAIGVAKKAAEMAAVSGDKSFFEQLRERLELYQAGKPFRE